jgi:uncharacterized membrane protein YfcA
MMALATLAVVAGSIVFFPGTANVTSGIDSPISPGLFALLVVTAVAAGAIKGMLGFGYAIVATPVFASVIDPTLAVVVLAIPPWMLNMFQIGETDTGLAFVREEWVLMGLAIVGTVVGVSFLAEFSAGPIVPFLMGLVILAYVVFQVVQDFVTIDEAHHPVALGVAGLLEGFLLAVSNLGPLLPAYFHTFERDAERYIGGLSMVLGTIFTVRILQMALFTDLITTYRLWLGHRGGHDRWPARRDLPPPSRDRRGAVQLVRDRPAVRRLAQHLQEHDPAAVPLIRHESVT